jgi:hypothetical protein
MKPAADQNREAGAHYLVAVKGARRRVAEFVAVSVRRELTAQRPSPPDRKTGATQALLLH